jgi:hypothetical protein
MKENRHLVALRQIAEVVTFSRNGVKWFGEEIIRLSPVLMRRPLKERAEYLTLALREVLYSHFYTIGRPVLRGELIALRGAAAARSLTSVLHLSNPGAGRVEHEWRYVRPGRLPGTLMVEKNRLAVAIHPHDLIGVLNVSALKPGDELLIRTPAGRMNLSPGYYVAHSDAELSYAEPLARIYFNVSPDAAPSLLHQVCRALNESGFAFDFKLASDASAYHRADVAVLYLSRAKATAALATVNEISSSINGMRSATPVLTHAIAPGVAVADDPGANQSFGLHRCQIIAEALLGNEDAFSGYAPFSRIRAAFARAGLSVELPYLAPGQPDIYVSPLLELGDSGHNV